MRKKAGPLDIYKYLPKINCKKCGEKTCMAFSSQLIERKVELKDCPHLKRESFKALEEILAPAVREVVFGKPTVSVGGEKVLYRHELTYFNQTAIAIDIHDEMGKEELSKRIEFVNNFAHERIGETLTLQAIAIRNRSGDVEKFDKCVEETAKRTKKALILCSWNSESLDKALRIVGDKKPLVYAATKNTWKEVGELAVKYNCPVVAFADNDISELKSVVNALQRMGINDIVIDPGSHLDSCTLNNFVMLRRSATNEDKVLNRPILGIPAAVYLQSGDGLKEAMAASLMMAKYADLIILHNIEIWALLPNITLRQNLYTDPRRPVRVEAGLKEFGSPDENSPVLLTTNFALTYYTVASDIESAKVDCYLIVLDTNGIGVEAAVAGRQLSASRVKKVIDETGIEKKIRHKKMVIPGLAARISGELEQLSGWKVLIGPKDSSEIGRFIERER
ncbi:MAG: acetyl-CoA decarbonylase/synthase complex subunit gamma [Methanosarcinales archaeon Met12]|nr:MAG: acetyl-CoA decarbonylase/synthase complex subunit gamma [Methanosarcinales archaeon Met12]